MIGRTISLSLAIVLTATSAHAFTGKDKKPDPKKDEGGIKTLAEVTKKCKRHDGLFTLYQDSTNGALYLLVKKSQLDKDYLHFSQVSDGVLDAGYFRGAYGSNTVIRFERYFDRVEVRQQNTSFYFDPENALSRAAQANINRPVLLAEKIAAANKSQDSLLIAADAMFIGEGLQQIKFPAPPGFPPQWVFDIGSLDKDKSKVLGIRNYPMNTDVVAEVVWNNPYPQNYGSIAVGDPRSTALRFHHSLIELPKNDFRPRFDDPRIGYFSEQVNDMTTKGSPNYRDLIHRWYLKKKDPSAALSEPVEPITWWMENTTPRELRPAIKEGVESWNLAFEKAGFKNAIVVKEQPDTATWDAGDIRYNVLRWTSSPEPPFGGYGPSFVDPRTGQILGADVMLEWVFVTNRIKEDALFNKAGLGYMAQDQEHNEAHPERCSMSSELQASMAFGLEVLDAMDMPEVERSRMVTEAIHELVLHEVGHTLGLMHNMKASSIHTPDELRDRALTTRTGLTGSVMDYTPSNLPTKPGDEVQYFINAPGPYDNWAIRYGYMSDADPAVEDLKLKAIASESTDPMLLFGNDADDMRSPGGGIDPRVMIDDNSSDPVEWAIQRVALADRTLKSVRQRYGNGGRSYQELLESYFWCTGRMITACNVMTRQIGGIYVDRSFTDQTTPNKPFTPVPYATQKKAMTALSKWAFAPDAFQSGTDLFAYLQMQRRGFELFWGNEDPHVHDRIQFARQMMLWHLLHPETLRRMIDSELYGNTYKLGEYMTDLTNACFDADKAGAVNTFRQDLQQTYVDMLIDVTDVHGSYREHARSMATYELDRIRKGLSMGVTDKGTVAHRLALKLKIDRALSATR